MNLFGRFDPLRFIATIWRLLPEIMGIEFGTNYLFLLLRLLHLEFLTGFETVQKSIQLRLDKFLFGLRITIFRDVRDIKLNRVGGRRGRIAIAIEGMVLPVHAF